MDVPRCTAMYQNPKKMLKMAKNPVKTKFECNTI